MTEVQRVHEWKVWHCFFFNQKNECLYKKLALISPQVTETEEGLTNVTKSANNTHNTSAQSLLKVHIPGDSSTAAPLPPTACHFKGRKLENLVFGCTTWRCGKQTATLSLLNLTYTIYSLQEEKLSDGDFVSLTYRNKSSKNNSALLKYHDIYGK